MSNELHLFVKESLEKGQSRDAIQKILTQTGWQEEEVKKALFAYADVQFPIAVPKPKPYLQAREAFLYLVSFITLYVTAFSFGALLFYFIEQAYPDPLTFRFASTGSLNTSLASIIIAFPVYLLVTWRLRLGSAKDPEKRQSKIRKWLTYFTLVVATGIIIGDLIAILSSLLGGEITTRFTLKALTILAIAGTIFGYYLWDLRKEEKENKDE